MSVEQVFVWLEGWHDGDFNGDHAQMCQENENSQVLRADRNARFYVASDVLDRYWVTLLQCVKCAAFERKQCSVVLTAAFWKDYDWVVGTGLFDDSLALADQFQCFLKSLRGTASRDRNKLDSLCYEPNQGPAFNEVTRNKRQPTVGHFGENRAIEGRTVWSKIA